MSTMAKKTATIKRIALSYCTEVTESNTVFRYNLFPERNCALLLLTLDAFPMKTQHKWISCVQHLCAFDWTNGYKFCRFRVLFIRLLNEMRYEHRLYELLHSSRECWCICKSHCSAELTSRYVHRSCSNVIQNFANMRAPIRVGKRISAA